MSASDITALTEMLIEVRREIAELRREAANMIRTGTVAAVDPARGYRVDIGPDDQGQPKLTPWLPHPEAGGDLLSWAPLTVGQVVTLLGSPGDPRKAVLLRSGFTDQFQAPSQDIEENMLEYGRSKVIVRKENTLVNVGDSFADLRPDRAFVKVRWPESEHFTDVEVRRDNIIFTVRGPQGQIVAQRTVV